MNRVFNNGLQNGVEGIEKINAQQIKDIEPFCAGIEGIWVPCTGIVDYVGLTNKLAELIEQQFTGSKVFTGHEVTAFVKQDGKTTVVTNKQKFTTKHLISCTGLFSDRMAKADGVNPNMQIVGFRGDYYDLTEKGMNKVRNLIYKVRNLIYPVPNPEFPFLGVHFTRMIQHGVECGPNAVFTFKREGYGKTDFDLKIPFRH